MLTNIHIQINKAKLLPIQTYSQWLIPKEELSVQICLKISSKESKETLFSHDFSYFLFQISCPDSY